MAYSYVPDNLPTKEDVRELIVNNSPSKSMTSLLSMQVGLSALHAKYAEALFAVEEGIKNLKLLLGDIKVEAGSDPEPEHGEDWIGEIPDNGGPRTIRQEVVEVLRDDRQCQPTVIPEIVAILNERSRERSVIYQEVRNALHAGGSSLVATGEVIMFEKGQGEGGRSKTHYQYDPNALAANANAEIDVSKYVAKIVEADPSVDPADPLVIDAAETFGIYTEKVIWPRNGGRRLQANHTFKAIRNRGFIGGLKAIVMSPNVDGFDGLRQIGRADRLIENVVLRHEDRFDAETIDAAKARVARGQN